MNTKPKTICINRVFSSWIFYTVTAFAIVVVQSICPVTLYAAQPDWYRLRTNSVPHQPKEVIVDSSGGLWVTAIEGTEYEPGVWFLAPGSTSFQYITNNIRNNYLSPAYSNLVVKPELTTTVLYTVKDYTGNTCYSLQNRTVVCEKPDGTFKTLTMRTSSNMGADTTNVDSVHRIRLIDDSSSGTKEKLLIAATGIMRVNSQLNEVVFLPARSSYNNDFISDALIDSQGRFWMASGRGIEKGTTFYNTVFSWVEFPGDLSAPTEDKPITLIEEDGLGNIWLASGAYGSEAVYCYTIGGEWKKYDLSVLLPGVSNQVFSIKAGDTGTVFLSSLGSGLIRFIPDQNGGQWSRFTGAELGLQSASILSVATADSGLWLVSDYNPAVSGNGTGVHYLTFDQTNQPQIDSSYTYRESSTTLTSNRLNFAVADQDAGVWFPAYDDPSIARLKADGTWQQFRGTTGNPFLGEFGIYGAGIDSNNIIYFAPVNSPPVAYDVSAEQWLALPSSAFTEFYYYGMTVDASDGKWFHGAFGVYYLTPDNSGWTHFASPAIPEFADNYVEDAKADGSGNMWFSTRYGLTLMKKDPDGGSPDWLLFTRDDGVSGYTAPSYRVFIDDSGRVWSSNKQRFDPQSNTWQVVVDTSGFDHRHLKFPNGNIPSDMDLTGALPGVTQTDSNRMTVDTRGNIYFAGGMVWLQSVNAGIVIRSPVPGDIDRNGLLQLRDAVESLQAITAPPSPSPQAYPTDVNSDGKIGLVETIFILQNLADE